MKTQEIKKLFIDLLDLLSEEDKGVDSSDLEFGMFLNDSVDVVKRLSDRLNDIIGKKIYRGYEAYLIDFPESCPSWSYWRKPGDVFVVKGNENSPSYLPGNYFDVEICKQDDKYYIAVYEDTELFLSVDCRDLEDVKIRIEQLERNVPIDWKKLEQFGYK